CKVMCAPAMDEDMWHHFTTQRNIATLKNNGNIVLGVGAGELASGLVGEGRMQEPEDILVEIKSCLRKENLKGQKILITSGPTHEALDPVRFIANHSTGKMGKALAEAFYENGAEIVFITGTSAYLPVYKNIQIVHVDSAAQMYDECITYFHEASIAVLAAAVADYSPVETAVQKIKKSQEVFSLQLKKTKDILKELGRIKINQLLVGFALETNNELENAKKKLSEKNADLIVLNSMQDHGAGFGYDTNRVVILDKSGDKTESNLMSKKDIANLIVAVVEEKIKHNGND
ncbi:MAG TPA: bifunctional phosphopantothenoylcysteine decarboxylase/phosphopantothenate--cysteine ligase CoaBC, partial [Arachidicoccus sp.]